MSLISVADLAARIDEPDLIVCDVRFYLADHDQGRREYNDAHLPGARFVDLHTELAGGPGGGRHPLPAVADFAALLGRLGVEPNSLVVAYDSASGAIASRLWWMLRSLGHGQVAVLDGGYPAWVAAGHPTTNFVPATSSGTYPAAPDWTGLVDADAVEQGARFGATVIDSRSPERFRGDTEPLDARAGHIPGAVNYFHADNVGPDGLMLSVPELSQKLAGLGANPIVYCGSGVTACHNLLAMSLVGRHGGRLYPGSWSEWSADPDRAITTGD